MPAETVRRPAPPMDLLEELRAIKEIARLGLVALANGNATTASSYLNRITNRADDAIRWAVPPVGWNLTDDAVGLRSHVEDIAAQLAGEFGRSRVGVPHRDELGRVCVTVTGMTDDIERAFVRIYPDGRQERVG